LGGGSLFTTYGATIRGKDGNQQKIVIKMLNPNAEEFIHMSYDFSSEVLAQAEQESGGKTKQDIKFANSLLELSKTWCIKDINDDVYPELDDLFHSTAQSYNQDKGKVLIELPGRIQATKKIKVEALYPGVTLNKFLAKENVSAEKKREVVQDLLDFFDYQFTFSPRTTTAGQKEYIFHSDPHTGNYMIDVEAPSQRLGVIDRSLYISLKEEDVNILKLLKVGENLKFIRSFTDKCLELSQTPESEAKKIRSKISVKLVSEAITQSLKGEKNDSAYLQIILQEFAQYGEKYSVKDINSANLDRSKLQKNQLMIIDYLKDNPNVEISVMYDVLKNLMLNGTKDSIRQLTFAQFKKIVSNMFEDKILFKKTIEVPLEYRLMIRNIVAMKNLKKKWT